MGDGPNAGATIRRYATGAIIVVALAIFSKGGALKQKILDKVHGVSGQATEVAVRATASAPTGHYSLPDLRKSLKTTVGQGERDDTPAPEPPAGVLEKVSYAAPLGRNVAYVTPVRPGARGPAIVWIVGGFGFGIDENAWQTATRDNDQSAAVFRKAGIAQMYPALRGASQNPGHHECFLGEVDDILAATDFLAQRPDVDPARIYLGGHSTGGTMVLLAAESTSRYRAVFAFGPVGDIRQYGKGSCLPAGASAQGDQGARTHGVSQRDRLVHLHHRGHEERQRRGIPFLATKGRQGRRSLRRGDRGNSLHDAGSRMRGHRQGDPDRQWPQTGARYQRRGHRPRDARAPGANNHRELVLSIA